MKGFKDTTKTQMGHGSYDEVPTRPATSKDVAAAKAGRIVTPGKPAPKSAAKPKSINMWEDLQKTHTVQDPLFEDSDAWLNANDREGMDSPRMIRDIKSPHFSKSENAELERKARAAEKNIRDNSNRIAPEGYRGVTRQSVLNALNMRDKAPVTVEDVKFEVRPKRFAVGGVVPPVASGGMPAQGKPIMSANDARTAPPMQNGQRPMINRPAPRPAPPAPAVGKGGLPQAWRDGYAADSARRLGTPMPSDAIKSVPKPAAPTLPTVKAYKRGGKVVEKATGETYSSKAAMKKHEAKESKSEQRAERKQEGGELLAGRAQSLRDMVGKPAARAGYAQGGKPKSKWS
jgi:hypothetical protein